jgi:phenylacetate-coenzyme A ligase PaaK-like adenylate-forming protein
MSLSGAPQWIYQGLVDADYCLLPIGSYDTRQKLRILREFRADVLLSTPSYAEYLATAAKEEGVSPSRDLNISQIFVATEAFSVSRAQRIETAYGAELHEWYGCTQRGMAFSCASGALRNQGIEGRGILHFDRSRVYAELVDPDSGELLIDPGSQDLHPGEDEVVGELVLTFFGMEASPLIRFRTRDRVRAVPSSACPCGRPGFGILSGTVSRYDNMMKVRGVLLDPAAVDGVLLGEHGVRDYRGRIFHDQNGREVVELSVLSDATNVTGEALRDINNVFVSHFGLNAEVRKVDRDLEVFDDTRRKAARWTDERAK